jgi:hypothetical protein
MQQTRHSQLSPFLFPSIILLFFILGLFRLNHHEMWLDETGPWLQGRDSDSLSELHYNKRYEGHPDLWYILLFLLSRLTADVAAMQWLHLVLITGFLGIFLYKSPFPLVYKLLFGLSYYIFYEYQMLSRLYAVELLLMAVLCAWYYQKKRFQLAEGLLLFLLAQTNLFGLIFTAGFLALRLLALYQDKNLGKTNNREAYLAGFLTVLGIGFSVYTVIPPADCGYAAGWHFSLDGLRFKQALGVIWNGFVPFPILYVEFWNNNIIVSENTRAVLGLLVYGASICFFLKKPKILLFYLFLTGSALLFFYTKHLGSTRHHGQLFFYFLAALWLSQNADRKSFLLKFPSPIARTLVLYLILLAQVGAGIFAAAVDWVYPFAPNKQAADFIRSLPKHYPIVAQHHLHSSTIAAYLNTKLYYPNTHKFGSFYQLSWRDLQIPTVNQSLQASRQLAGRLKKPVLLITVDQLEHPENAGFIKPLYKTDTGILGSLTYYIYEIE